MTLGASQTLAEHRGRTVVVAFTTPDHVAVYDDGGDFPDALDRGRRRHEKTGWVALSKQTLSRVRRRSVTATWRGERVVVNRVDGDEVGFSHYTNARWAADQGLNGSQYEGAWWGRTSRSELTEVRVEESEVTLP